MFYMYLHIVYLQCKMANLYRLNRVLKLWNLKIISKRVWKRLDYIHPSTMTEIVLHSSLAFYYVYSKAVIICFHLNFFEPFSCILLFLLYFSILSWRHKIKTVYYRINARNWLGCLQVHRISKLFIDYLMLTIVHDADAIVWWLLKIISLKFIPSQFSSHA